MRFHLLLFIIAVAICGCRSASRTASSSDREPTPVSIVDAHDSGIPQSKNRGFVEPTGSPDERQAAMHRPIADGTLDGPAALGDSAPSRAVIYTVSAESNPFESNSDTAEPGTNAALSPPSAATDSDRDADRLATDDVDNQAAAVQPDAATSIRGNSDTNSPVTVESGTVDPGVGPTFGISLTQVIQSVHQSYPLVQAAFLERQVADGNQLSAWGEFDTKLKASTENTPLGFYETYRHVAGVSKPLFGGGELFGGYRSGRGDFEPWYKERQTDDSGEFKAGVRVPLLRDRDIDTRRAALWRATYDQQITNPFIRASLVQFSREAGLAYWKWVAAGQKVRLGQQWLDVAAGRNTAIRRRVELQDLDPPELIDNERAIAKREAKLADATREFQQATVKLSLFLRDVNGLPVLADINDLPDFPMLRDVSTDTVVGDIGRALQSRPELTALDLQWRQLQIDYAEACNLTRPGLDAQLTGTQDVGEPATSKRDKSEFELEASLFFDVPVERRKGRGKMHAVQGKMAQVSAKRRLTQDKIRAEVQAAYAGMIQSGQEAIKARRAVTLASRMADIERRKFEVGDSDLLKVALREQYAVEAAEEEIGATYRHFVAFTDYAATLAIDRPSETLLRDMPVVQ